MTDVLLIDGDILAYQVCTAAMREVEIDGEVTYSLNRDEARSRFKAKIDYWLEELDCVRPLLAWSHREERFRDDLDENYKGNRTGKKPLGYWALVETWMDEWPSRCIAGLEGDDVLGILQTRPDGPSTICLSEDKDLKTIPGLHSKMNDLGVFEVTLEEADTWWMVQTLAGDRTDGYKGCPGVGEVTAARLLEPQKGDLPAMWEIVLRTYEDKGLTYQDALRNAQMARILRHEDYPDAYPWCPSALIQGVK